MKERSGRSGELCWLDNKSWWEVTREERYFCAELYCAIKHDIDKFVCFLQERYGSTIAPISGFQVGFEVCFYRDWIHMGSNGKPEVPENLSRKRTFDLALFSDSQILIIEAKAHEKLNGKELESIRMDKKLVQQCTGVPVVHTTAIVSSRYSPRRSTVANFSLTPLMRWKQLAEVYGQYAQIFLRADSIYGD